MNLIFKSPKVYLSWHQSYLSFYYFVSRTSFSTEIWIRAITSWWRHYDDRSNSYRLKWFHISHEVRLRAIPLALSVRTNFPLMDQDLSVRYSFFVHPPKETRISWGFTTLECCLLFYCIIQSIHRSVCPIYCLTKISIRAKRSISRVFTLFIVPSPFFVHCPYKSRINRAESVLTGLKAY